MIYAGIGSRETPYQFRAVMENYARYAAWKGLKLSTGGAKRSDEAFMLGAYSVYGSSASIYLSKPSHTVTAPLSPLWRVHTSVCEQSLELARRFHPAWHKCNQDARLLHARNGYIILDVTLDTPVDFVVAWTEGGKGRGGTGQGLRIARYYRIPILDLGKFDDVDAAEKALMRFHENHCR